MLPEILGDLSLEVRNATDFDYDNMDYFNKGHAWVWTVYLIASHEVTPATSRVRELIYLWH